MPRIVILIIVLVLIIGGLVLLSTMPKEQPTRTIPCSPWPSRSTSVAA